MIKINCIYNDEGVWCKNKNIKRSLFGIGKRCCIKFGNFSERCIYCEKYPRPEPPKP